MRTFLLEECLAQRQGNQPEDSLGTSPALTGAQDGGEHLPSVRTTPPPTTAAVDFRVSAGISEHAVTLEIQAPLI